MNTKKNNESRTRLWIVLFLWLLGGYGLTALPVAAAPFAYVVNQLDSSVSVIDTTTPNTIVDTVTVGYDPTGGIAVAPDGKRVYVTNINRIGTHSDDGGYVSVIDTTTTPNKVVDEVALGGHVGFYPADLVVAPDGKRVYVVNEGDSSVSVIDTTKTPSAVVGNVALVPNSFPSQAAVTPDGKRVYVPISIRSRKQR